MRVKISRLTCVTLFVLMSHLFWQGCSSTQQEDEMAGQEGYGQEGYDQEGNAEDAGYAEESGYEDGYDYGEEEGNADATAYANGAEEYTDYEGYGEESEELANAQLGNQILDGEQTKSDLEDIIAGQNADMAEEIPADVANVESGADYDGGMNAEMASNSTMPSNPVPPVAQANASVPETPGVSAGPALPEMGAKMPYIVRVGESLSSIAMKIYGSSDKWQEMVELTSLSNPNLVKPGDVVYYQLTESTLAFASAYEGATRDVVTVQPGDTLAGIAQRIYGAAGDWKFIWRHNSELANPDKLEVGQAVYYVNPASLSAAIDKLKTLTIADLIDKSFEKQDPNANYNQTVDNFEAQAESVQPQQVNGFQIAKTMFNVFTSNIGIAG